MGAGVTFAAGGADWMKGLDDRKLLSQVTLPGSHNAGVLRGGRLAACQSDTISKQLSYGVRVLDIRCRHEAGRFKLVHGVVDQQLRFGEVLRSVYDFLEVHPSETVVMMIKEEGSNSGAKAFKKTFSAYVEKDPERWWTGAGVPRLEQVRGKLVLLRRFGAAKGYGLDGSVWANNTVFEKNGLRVQDRYVVKDNAGKWKVVKEALHAAAAERVVDRVHVNFASGYRPGMLGLPDIRAVSDFINPRLEAYFRTAGPGHHGWVMMDFVTPDRVGLIYRCNQFK